MEGFVVSDMSVGIVEGEVCLELLLEAEKAHESEVLEIYGFFLQ